MIFQLFVVAEQAGKLKESEKVGNILILSEIMD